MEVSSAQDTDTSLFFLSVTFLPILISFLMRLIWACSIDEQKFLMDFYAILRFGFILEFYE